MNELTFINKNATPNTVIINCRRKDIVHILAWYGAYFAGDNYKAFYNGKKLNLDINGGLIE